MNPEPSVDLLGDEFAGEPVEYSESQKHAALISRLRAQGIYCCSCGCERHDNGRPEPRPLVMGRKEDY
jgi:hypothetical protein